MQQRPTTLWLSIGQQFEALWDVQYLHDSAQHLQG